MIDKSPKNEPDKNQYQLFQFSYRQHCTCSQKGNLAQFHSSLQLHLRFSSKHISDLPRLGGQSILGPDSKRKKYKKKTTKRFRTFPSLSPLRISSTSPSSSDGSSFIEGKFVSSLYFRVHLYSPVSSK